MIKTRNIIIWDIFKYTNCNCNNNLFLKQIKIIKIEKLADSIFALIKKLKLCYKDKMRLIKWSIK